MREADVHLYGLGARQNGLLTVHQLRFDVALTDAQIDHRVGIGALERRHRSVYALAAWPRSPQQDAHAALLAAGRGAVVSHEMAAFLWGLADEPPSEVDVCVPPRRHPRVAGCVVHRVDVERRHRVHRPDGIVLTSAPLTLLHLAATRSPDALEDAFENGQLLGLITVRRMRRVLDSEAGRGVPGSAPLRRLVAAREHTSRPGESTPERELLRLVRRAGLPEPVRQLVVATARGRRRLDLAWPELHRGVEVDSARWHGSDRAERRDDERDLDLLEVGWGVHHVRVVDIRAHPQSTLERIRRFLALPPGAVA